MILNITNLGPLKKAKLDISKKLLFFVGFNNSGKTYLSQLIWGLYNRSFYDKFIDNCDVNKILKTENIANLSINEEITKTLLNEYTEFVKNNIHLIFKIEKKYFEHFTIDLVLNKDIAKLVDTDMTVDFSNEQDEDEKITITSKANNHTLDINLSKSVDNEDIKRRIVHFLFIGLFDTQSFYLPSTRGTYTTFYQYIYKIEKDKKDNIELPMYLASSNSNQLTTLYFYFRHWVSQTNRNFLVLDEPEENLHPKHQYELLNTLIDFTAKGNKLLLTTHSILKENLSNSVDIVENNINGNTILQRTTIKDTLIQNPTSNDHFSIDFINDIISKV